MIKFKTVYPDGKIGIGLGITARNLELLKEDRPILFDLAAFGLNAKIMIIYGKNEQTILKALEPFISSDTIIHSDDSGGKPN